MKQITRSLIAVLAVGLIVGLALAFTVGIPAVIPFSCVFGTLVIGLVVAGFYITMKENLNRSLRYGAGL